MTRYLPVLLLAAILLTACQTSTSSTPTPGTERTAAPTEQGATPEPDEAATATPRSITANVRHAFTADGRYSWLYLARHAGFFAEEGLDVVVEEGDNATQVTQLVATGQDFMATPDMATVALLIEQGAPIKVVAVLEQSQPPVIMVRSDSDIQTAADLEGKTILTGPGVGATLLEPYLAANGVDIGSVTIINTDHGTKLQSFLGGQGDAVTVFYTNEVQRIRTTSDPEARVFFYDDVFGMPGTVLVVNQSSIDNEPDAVRGMVRALLRAEEVARDDPDRAIDALEAIRPERVDNRDVALAQIEAHSELVFQDGEELGVCDPERMAETLSVLRDHMGFAGSDDIAQYCTNEFLD